MTPPPLTFFAFCPGGSGAGLFISGGTVSLGGVTVASNQNHAGPGVEGDFCGGGIANAGANRLVTNATLIGNNSSFGSPDDVLGPISCSYSLISQTVDSVITNNGGNIFDLNPMLDPGGLKSNGGPTPTVALQQGSPAIDAVPVDRCTDGASPPHLLTIDQRGFPRPDAREQACDIGAFESR